MYWSTETTAARLYYAGGGGAASDCSNGYPGNQGTPENPGTGGISYHCSGGFWGGDGGNWGYNGPATASGGGATGFFQLPTKGGPGLVMMYYTCSTGTTGTIGNAHTVTYPPELTPDKITSTTDPVLPTGVNHCMATKYRQYKFCNCKNNQYNYNIRFDNNKLKQTTYYRRGNNACVIGGGFGNWSDTVKIVWLLTITATAYAMASLQVM